MKNTMHLSKRYIAVMLGVPFMLAAGQHRAGAQSETGSSTATVGHVTITARQSEAANGYVIYRDVVLKTQNGATLSTDELKANLAGGGKLSTAEATGHVKAVVDQVDLGRTYTVTANKAVYDPKANKIDLTGDVKTTIRTGMTEGPLVQTGETGTIFLGKAPDFPKIVMTQVHTEFTPLQ